MHIAFIGDSTVRHTLSVSFGLVSNLFSDWISFNHRWFDLICLVDPGLR
jgi:hypothetical protein